MDPEFLTTDGEHEHDKSVTSLSVIQPGDVDLDKVQPWISDILRDKGADIYRMKGTVVVSSSNGKYLAHNAGLVAKTSVLAIAGSSQKFVYQAVHMIFTGDFDEEWGLWHITREAAASPQMLPCAQLNTFSPHVIRRPGREARE